MTRVNETSPFNEVTVANSTSTNRIDKDAVRVNVTVPNNVWFLYLAPDDGWDVKWEAGVLALVVIVSLAISLLTFFTLVFYTRRRMLLLSMLPKRALQQVDRGNNFMEHFSNVTVLFSDIVSFTTMASEMSPIQVVSMLNELYCAFDALADKHHLVRQVAVKHFLRSVWS